MKFKQVKEYVVFTTAKKLANEEMVIYIKKNYQRLEDKCDHLIRLKVPYLFEKERSKAFRVSEFILSALFILIVPLICVFIEVDNVDNLKGLGNLFKSFKDVFYPNEVWNMSLVRLNLMLISLILFLFESLCSGGMLNFVRKLYLRNACKVKIYKGAVPYSGFNVVYVGVDANDEETIIVTPVDNPPKKKVIDCKTYIISKSSIDSIILEDYCTGKFEMDFDSLVSSMINLVFDDYYVTEWIESQRK